MKSPLALIQEQLLIISLTLKYAQTIQNREKNFYRKLGTFFFQAATEVL